MDVDTPTLVGKNILCNYCFFFLIFKYIFNLFLFVVPQLNLTQPNLRFLRPTVFSRKETDFAKVSKNVRVFVKNYSDNRYVHAQINIFYNELDPTGHQIEIVFCAMCGTNNIIYKIYNYDLFFFWIFHDPKTHILCELVHGNALVVYLRTNDV